MTRIAEAIEWPIRALGDLLKWALPVVVALAAAVAILRYGFSMGRPWLSESFVWLNGIIVLLAAAVVLADDGHIRVDLFYRRFGTKGRAISNLAGTVLFLWPMSYVLFQSAWPSTIRSWRLLEHSPT